MREGLGLVADTCGSSGFETGRDVKTVTRLSFYQRRHSSPSILFKPQRAAYLAP